MQKKLEWKNRIRKGIAAVLLVIVFLCGELTGATGYAIEENDNTGAKSVLRASITIDPILPGEGMTDVVLENVLSEGGTLANIPIYRICKGTGAGKHYTIFFVGDGYTEAEQESFVRDAREKMRLFLSYSPMNLFADRFDAYAALVPSQDSGPYVPGTSENFFHATGSGTGQKASVFQKIRNPLAAALHINKDTVTHTYPDNEVYNTVLIVNKAFGAGIASTGGRYTHVGKGSPEVFLHETGHASNSLTDEYFMGGKVDAAKTKANRIYIADIARDGLTAQEINSLTMYDYDKLDVTKVRWKEYLGFRGIYIDSFDDVNGKPASQKEFRPNHKQSMMGAAGKPFCAVCEAEIFTQLNKYFGYPTQVFIPKPEFSYKLVENPTYFCNKPSSQGMVKPDKTYLPSNGAGAPAPEFKRYDSLSIMNSSGENPDCADAAQHDITFRTVVVPYRKEANLKLKLTVMDSNNSVMAVREKDFNVSNFYTSQTYASQAATSLELTLKRSEWDAITGGSDADLSKYKIIGEIIDIPTGEVLSTTDPA